MEITSQPNVTGNSTTDSITKDTLLQEAGTYMTYKVAKYIDNYWFPVLIPFGLIGNVGVSRGYTDYHQGRAIHMADSRIH